MKKRHIQIILGTLALVGFLGVSIFWWAGIHQGENHICISAILQEAACPNAMGTDAASFHLNTLQSLTTIGLQAWQSISALLVLALIVSLGVALIPRTVVLNRLLRRYDTVPVSLPSTQQHWLARLEHSPSIPY